MSECLSYTISEVTDRFLLRAGIDQKKYFARYLVLAQECWEDLFQNTLWVVKSVWMPTKAGNPYNYVDVPPDCLRLLSVGRTDDCNLIQPLYYNNQINVVPKPTSKKCGCSCDCGGLCNDVNSTTVTTKLMFSINNVDYYQKCWLQVCPNGDTIEWCQTPVKKYNTTAGHGGDYNDDFNNDFSHVLAGFADFTVETLTTQKKVCQLEVLPCGCPVDTPANNELFMDCCGFYVNYSCRKKHCKQFSPNINNNRKGEVKLSQCGTRIEFIPPHPQHCETTVTTPDYLLVNYQTTGESVGSETLVPKFARNAMYSFLDCSRKEYNSVFSISEKQDAYYRKIAAKNEIVGYLNPINLQELSAIQDISIKY